MNDVPIIREQRLQEINNYIFRMPSLSTTVTKALEICNDPNSSPNDLNRVISLDPVLTGQVLRLVNSAYYSFSNKITTLTRAIIMLGVNTVKNLVLSTAIIESLGGKRSFKALSSRDFWTHSICVGVVAKSLAAIKDIPVAEREEYFVAGLLHDLGKILLDIRFPGEYAQALELAKFEQEILFRAEDSVIGINHNMVGKMIAEKWHLGEALIDSLFYHHNPDKAKDENRQFIAIVALANIYANNFKIGSSGDHFSEDPVKKYLLEQVGVNWSTLSDLRENVLEEIEKARIFLQVIKKG